MWNRLFALILKELLANIQDRQTRLLLLVAPPLLLLVYAFALTQEVKNVSVAILNEDLGLSSQELVARFTGSPTFKKIHYLDRPNDIKKVIETKSALMVIHIQADFSRKIGAGDPAPVQIILDGRRSNVAQILQGYTQQIVADYNAELIQSARVPLPEPPSTIVARTFFNPNFDTIWSGVPGLFAGLVATVGFMVSALSVAREREMGTFEQLLVSPLTPIEILIGKTVPALIIALASAAAMLLLGLLVLGVPFEGSVALLFLSTVVYLAAIIGIGLFISSLASTQQQAIIGLFMYMVPAVLLSGYATPIENMPDWLQSLTQTNPITHFIVICRGLFLKEVPASVIIDHLWPMATIGAVTLSGGAWLFRKQLQ